MKDEFTSWVDIYYNLMPKYLLDNSPFGLEYNYATYLIEPFTFIRDIYTEIKYFIQRGKRGWSDRDAWGWCTYHTKTVIAVLKYLQENRHGYPHGLTSKQWDKVLNTMIIGFQADLDRENDFTSYRKIGSEEAKKLYAARNKKLEKALNLYAKRIIMSLIGVSGKRGSGKDTLANYLVRTYGFTKLSFAALLKQHVRDFFGMTVEHTDGPLKEIVDERYSKSPRQIMIAIGQFYRSFDPDFWIKAAFKDIDPNKDYVISDLRFKNEANYLRNVQGATIVRLNRYKNLNIYGSEEINDISETDLDDYVFDLVIPTERNVDLKDIASTADLINSMKGLGVK